MPQVEFYLECVPKKIVAKDNEVLTDESGETILRIHIFDRQASSYDTVGSLLANARDSDIASVGNIPQAPRVEDGASGASGTPEVVASRARLHNLFLET